MYQDPSPVSAKSREEEEGKTWTYELRENMRARLDGFRQKYDIFTIK